MIFSFSFSAVRIDGIIIAYPTGLVKGVSQKTCFQKKRPPKTSFFRSVRYFFRFLKIRLRKRMRFITAKNRTKMMKVR